MRYNIVFHPSWWHKRLGIDFSRAFWDDPATRIQADSAMRRFLFERFGAYGLGEENPAPRPLLGSDHLACGFLFSELLGCDVVYKADDAPQVICSNLDDDACFALTAPDLPSNEVWQRVERQIESLMRGYGRVESYINLMGVQNIALDLRGSDLFIDYHDEDSPAQHLLSVACDTILAAGARLSQLSPALSGGVTNIVKSVLPDVFLASNCSVELVSQQTYEEFLLPHDVRLAEAFPVFGIHHCGQTMEHVIGGYAKVPNLRFVEVGAFSDLAKVTGALPGDVLINARYSPVRLATVDIGEMREELREMARIVPGQRLSISCVGIDGAMPDARVEAFLEACGEVV